jgi:hypothetical protein
MESNRIIKQAIVYVAAVAIGVYIMFGVFRDLYEYDPDRGDKTANAEMVPVPDGYGEAYDVYAGSSGCIVVVKDRDRFENLARSAVIREFSINSPIRVAPESNKDYVTKVSPKISGHVDLYAKVNDPGENGIGYNVFVYREHYELPIPGKYIDEISAVRFDPNSRTILGTFKFNDADWFSKSFLGFWLSFAICEAVCLYAAYKFLKWFFKPSAADVPLQPA